MDLKKLLLSLAVSLPLAATGCGDDGPGETDPDPCEGVTGDVWELTGLTLPSEDANGIIDTIGFNIDDQVTPEDVDTEDKTPANGCGVPDQEGGVDNALGQLLAILPGLGEILGAEIPDIQAEIDNAIENGDVRIDAEVKNYEGVGSEGVTLSLRINGEDLAGLQDVEVEVDAEGNITAVVPNLPLSLSGIEIGDTEIDLTLNISNAIVFINAPGASETTTATIGGALFYGEEGDGGLRDELEGLIDALALDDGIGIEVIDEFLPSDISSDGSECDSVSLGAEASFRRVACE